MTLEETRELLGEMYGRYYELFMKQGIKYAQSQAEGEDILHDTMEKMLRPEIVYRLSGLEYEEIKRYILKSISNTAITRTREMKRIEDGYDMDQLEEEAATPEEQLLKQEDLERLREAILELPPKEREVLLEFSQNPELTYVDAAKKLGIDRKTVAKRYENGKRLLKEKLQ